VRQIVEKAVRERLRVLEHRDVEAHLGVRHAVRVEDPFSTPRAVREAIPASTRSRRVV
jgi:hypothetical protein